MVIQCITMPLVFRNIRLECCLRTTWIILLCHIALFDAYKVQTKLSSGRIGGFITHGLSFGRSVPLATFYGVPYAESTAGAKRWTAPIPKKAWSGIRNATRFGASCPGGAPVGNVTNAGDNFSEDCLFANIWTPLKSLSSSASKKLPVVLWIHGGGFMLGTANDPVWWGNSWAARGLVFISFEYRLGAFGFFSSPSLPAVNVGFLDQQLMLRYSLFTVNLPSFRILTPSLFLCTDGFEKMLQHLVETAVT